MTPSPLSLSQLGWSHHFQAQLTPDECETHQPVRVLEVQRTHLETVSLIGKQRMPMTPSLADLHVAVGDWLLVAPDGRASLLERLSALSRRSAGTEATEQVIAANIDTMFIVSSCNADFNIARLERYLAMARQAGIEPVVLLTKADICEDPADFRLKAERALRGVLVETLNAREPSEVARRLGPWAATGKTLAMLGSSGVGKTTLANALTGLEMSTRSIREDDAKGRHTTTARSMFQLPGGAWLVDTPGMRELRLLDVADGIDAVFDDIVGFARSCRFRDCQHEAEPGCAVQDAISAGELDPDRLARWKKLQREDRFNSETVAEAHARSRKLAKLYAEGKKRAALKRGET